MVENSFDPLNDLEINRGFLHRILLIEAVILTYSAIWFGLFKRMRGATEKYILSREWTNRVV